MSIKDDIIVPLIKNLEQRIIEGKLKKSEIDSIDTTDDIKKKILKLMLKSCINQSQEVYSSLKNLIDSEIIENELISFINFCNQYIMAQKEALNDTNIELSFSNERHEYLSRLYEASENDMQEVLKVHNPANSFEEIEFRKAKKTDKIERTFQHMINDMIYLVDFLNRNPPKKKKSS